MTHVVLLGDSIFDNAPYVAGGPDVIQHLSKKLPADWQATLKAVDGSLVEQVAGQLDQLPPDATHLFVSVGGNNALNHINLLSDSANWVGEVLDRLANIRATFAQGYAGMLALVLAKQLPTTLCTIYDPSFPEEVMQNQAVTALTVFNDVIIRQATQHKLPLIDLRLVCTEPADYANPIEPSVQGGEKIAAAVVTVLETCDFTRRTTSIFT